jgi:hypothetical protein
MFLISYELILSYLAFERLVVLFIYKYFIFDRNVNIDVPPNKDDNIINQTTLFIAANIVTEKHNNTNTKYHNNFF